MRFIRNKHLFAVFFSVALHVALLALASGFQSSFPSAGDMPQAEQEIMFLAVLPLPPKTDLPAPTERVRAPDPVAPPPAAPSIEASPAKPLETAAPQPPPAFMEAPPAPTAEEWAFAAKYTLKNSKGYRYTWGQQVRSTMGTAVEGPDQGAVRFQVEIAPDGTLAKLDTLWTTSAVAEQLARKAIENMPALPPTPTGKPLIFEKTISFSPFASDGPPIYKDDCLPDPPAFRNPFAWDGTSPQMRAAPRPAEKHDPQAMEECLNQLPQDSIEAETARGQRLMDQWGWNKPGR